MPKKRKDPSIRIMGENASATWGVSGAHFRAANGKFAKDPIRKLKKQWRL